MYVFISGTVSLETVTFHSPGSCGTTQIWILAMVATCAGADCDLVSGLVLGTTLSIQMVNGEMNGSMGTQLFSILPREPVGATNGVAQP